MTPPSLTSKERVARAINHREPDRVPINFYSNPGLLRRLLEHYGLPQGDVAGLHTILGVDFGSVNAPYRGPKLHPDIPERGLRVDNWGVRRRWIEHESGGYWDFCEFPLESATPDEVADWPLPDPDDYDYSVIPEQCRKRKDLFVIAGNAGVVDIINANGRLRGMEQTLVDLITDDPAGLLLTQRRIDIQFEILKRTVQAAEGGVDMLHIGEDLGTQIPPIISPEIFRKHIRPHHQRFVDLAEQYGIPVMIHTCGSSSWAYEDFIEMGVRVVDTLQPEAAGMAPEYLRDTFGERLAFHGCISTAGPVAFGTPEDVVRDCRNILKIMMPGGGYCFAPTHALQDNSPTENVVAMYETARTDGRYD